MTRGLKKFVRKFEDKLPQSLEEKELFKQIFPVNYEKALKFFGRKKYGKNK